VSAVARLFIYATTCLATLALRRRDGRAPFTIPGGPVVPVLGLIVSLGILFGATQDQFVRGLAAFVFGGVLYFVARRDEPAA
jgi:APA family basic amino acid/polyamine antiporter